MPIKHSDIQIREMFDKISSNKIVLPDFQRVFVWTPDQQRRLLASFLVGLPIGSTLHLEGKKNDFAARSLCEQRSITPQEECQYVLDGQQRLSTLKNVFYDLFADKSKSWKDIWHALFKQLRLRWFLDLSNDTDDNFGYDRLNFDSSKLLKIEPKEIEDLFIFKKIYKTKELDKWWHPAFNPKDDDGNSLTGAMKQLAIARQAASEYLIPLYEIYKNNRGIHRRVIKELALKKVEELKSKVEDNEISLSELLSTIEPDIAILEQEGDDSRIRDAWSELMTTWINNVATYLENLLDRPLPVIFLPNNEINRATAIFEQINKGGTVLTMFDLLVAKAAKAGGRQKSLTQRVLDNLNNSLDVSHIDPSITDWKPSLMSSTEDNSPTKKFQSLYINSLSLIVYSKIKGHEINKQLISSNRKLVLDLSSDDINNNSDRIVKAISRAFAFLQLRCGHINEKVISYEYMVLPIIYLLDNDNIWNDIYAHNKIEAWFWASLFSGAYKERQDDKVISDLKNLKAWLVDQNISNIDKLWKSTASDGTEQITLKGLTDKILLREDYSDDRTLLNQNQDYEPPNAMKLSILQYVLSKKPNDFLSDTDKLDAYNAATGKIKALRRLLWNFCLE